MRSALTLVLMIFSINLSHANNVSHESYAKTKHPIVMVPGAIAFDTLDLGIFEIDYWFGVTKALREAGAEVYVTNLSGLQSNAQRGDELVSDLLAILADPEIEKVNLIAHSQGALAARYAAYVLPDKIASITTVAGMNRGTHISPWARSLANRVGIRPGSLAEKITDLLVGALFTGFEAITTPGKDGDYNSPGRRWQSLLAVEEATAPAKVELFNQQFPAGLPNTNCMTVESGRRKDVGGSENKIVNGVHYFSVGASSNSSATSFWENFDATHWAVTKLINSAIVAPNDRHYQWDGVVPQCGQKLGHYIGDFFMSHLDAIGHFAGITPSFVDSIYVTHANRLKNLQL